MTRYFMVRAFTEDEAKACKRAKLKEIVYCKDCVHSKIFTHGTYFCMDIARNGTRIHDEKWFCADGEREEVK